MPNAPLLSVADALARILAGADPMETEAIGLLDADGPLILFSRLLKHFKLSFFFSFFFFSSCSSISL